jgi:hypothetical protein
MAPQSPYADTPLTADQVAAAAFTDAPLFRTTNEKDALGDATIDPNTIGTGLRHFGQQVNPIAAIGTIGRALIPEVVARWISPGLTDADAQMHGPLNTVRGIGKAQEAVYIRAAQAYNRGDYRTAARHFVDYLIPVLGPALDRSSDLFQAGKWVAGGADALGLGLATFGPQAFAEAVSAGVARARAGAAPKVAQPGGGARLTPQEAASNAFADLEGIRKDAATATANPSVAGLQKMAGHTLAGSIPAGTFKALQDADLTRVGHKLAGEVHPVPMTPETAGAAARGRLGAVAQAHDAALTAEGQALAADVHPVAVTPETAGTAAQGRIQGSMRTFGDDATTQYETLRTMEADPAHVERVHTAPAGSGTFRKILNKLTAGITKDAAAADPEIATWAKTVGERAPTTAELAVMRQIEAELDAQPYTPYLLRPTKYGGGLEHVEGTGGAGAAVFDDVRQAAPGTARIDRGEMQAAIAQTLETGEWTNASRGAFKVAQDRLRSSGALRGPTLDPSAPLLGSAVDVGMPVHLATEKAMLDPLYRRLKRESELVPLQGDKARALVALDRLMTGPDVESLSIVDAALGDLKAMARSEIPELRTAGQGVAAAAVKRLSAAVDRAAAKAGPAAVEALEAGRRATVAKYEATGIYNKLRDEPVGTFRQLTQPKDAAIDFLRQFADHAPESLPEMGRALLEQWAELTPAKRADAWRGLGAESKRRLFGSDAQVARLDDFMQRATVNDAGAIAKQLRDEPVGSFNQLTAPDDAGIAFLRDVQRHAPETLPEIGRAKLQEWITKATEMGKFQHADKLYAEWHALGPETKRLLFGGPLQVQRLENFFTLAKRIAANPNPSGTATTAATAAAMAVFTSPLIALQAQVGGYALAKLLYTPRGIALVNRALDLSAKASGKAPSMSGAAAARAAWAEVANTAQARPAPAAPLVFPRAADRQAAPEQ